MSICYTPDHLSLVFEGVHKAVVIILCQIYSNWTLYDAVLLLFSNIMIVEMAEKKGLA